MILAVCNTAPTWADADDCAAVRVRVVATGTNPVGSVGVCVQRVAKFGDHASTGQVPAP